VKPEALDAKRLSITAFFDDLDKKVAFLDYLFKGGHKDEARMLCVCYIDGLSNWLHQDSTALAKNFSTALSKLSGEEVFSLLVPEFLLSSVPWDNAPKGAETQIRSALSKLRAREAVFPHELVTAVTPAITKGQLTWLKDELWRGSVAMAVYIAVRSPNIHWLGSGDALSFDRTTFRGRPLQRIDFPMLLRALQHLAAHARGISIKTGKWFGIN
jgi:hypothetical protein